MRYNRPHRRIILVAGASGYVGGRLVTALEERGEQVRCLARAPGYLAGRFDDSTEIVEGDVLDPMSLASALKGVGTAYYLVHSMGSKAGFEQRDRVGARNFARMARRRRVRRVIYLGGLVGDGELSSHLASRREVGDILAFEGPPTIQFRASIIIGSGSLSFELIRSLVNRLPVMVTPRWVWTRAQPIAIEDVIEYLIRALDSREDGSVVYEIGGPGRVSYGELMEEYARQIGVRRVLISLPFLSPRLSGLWLGLVTPVHARVGRKLIDSLRNETIVRDRRALADFPVRPLPVREAIARALEQEDREIAETRWSDAVSSSLAASCGRRKRLRSRVIDRKEAFVKAPSALAFAPIQRIGGSRGWYFATWLWTLRGMLDQLLGGVGMRRGRRHSVKLRPGDPVDFWRVEAFEPHRLLRLKAEMKLPGRAWLQFEVEPLPSGSRITQTAVFDPRGLGGLLYWYGLYPIHWLIFRGMLWAMVRRIPGAPPMRISRGSTGSRSSGTAAIREVERVA